jgi:prolipoprotein diacylglyceryltransferase
MTENDDDRPKSAAARLFDIRLLIGSLFVLYGVMLTIAGFVTSDAQRAKASGININMWLGLGMLVVGILFLLWLKVNPLRPDPNPTEKPRHR